jgi:Bacterial regulatory proteins, tetR family
MGLSVLGAAAAIGWATAASKRIAKDVQEHLLRAHYARQKETPMPYTAEHKHQTRKRIVQSARRLFNRNGFAEVSIQQIMEEAGLTHGGFYKHFSAKEELYREAVLEFICADRPEPWQMNHVDPAARGGTLPA